MIHLLIDKLPCSNTNDIEWKHMNNTLYNKYTQQLPTKLPEVREEKKPDKIKIDDVVVAQDVPLLAKEKPKRANVNETKYVKATKEPKATIIKPLEIILAESCTFDSSLDNVKEKLIEFITKREFSKVFGMTKSADIMSGIVNNRWNKSTALFISFLFNKSVNYNNTMVLYNSEKNNGVIETTA